MRLNEINDNPGSQKSRKRLGRGIGSGLGKTGGRGGKGQTARTGVRINGFEGGQMPLYRRLPKRGFNKPFRLRFNELNVGAIQAAIDAGRIAAGKAVTVESLVETGVLRRVKDGLRLLGDGELKARLAIEVHYATKSAIEAVEKAGGTVKILRKPKDEGEPKKPKKARKSKAAAEE
jgi:large subunit ribosomal protein L15